MKKVWKLKILKDATLIQETWTTEKIGGEEDFSFLLQIMLNRKDAGDQVRLEWSEQN